VLHGYSSFTTYAAGVLQLDPTYENEGFLVLMPVGTLDSTGNYFWNATDACCDQFGAGVDDVAYLNGVVDEVAAVYNVDAKRTYVVGHSNGGFMAYRMACESASRFAAIVSVAGATYDDAQQCDPSEQVSVLQVHGTADPTILYGGGVNAMQGNAAYPSAAGSVQRWAGYDGCAMSTTAGAAIDVTGDATAETTSLGHDACPAGIDVELWTVADAPHLIFFKPDPPLLWTWLNVHAKP
jgi:polyhydroxybutyrate depolymerase